MIIEELIAKLQEIQSVNPGIEVLVKHIEETVVYKFDKSNKKGPSIGRPYKAIEFSNSLPDLPPTGYYQP